MTIISRWSWALAIAASSCSAPLHLPQSDAEATDSAESEVEVDAGIFRLPVCRPSPITIERDCGGFTDGGMTCMIAPGIETAPCLFRGNYLVLACSQCWYLP